MIQPLTEGWESSYYMYKALMYNIGIMQDSNNEREDVMTNVIWNQSSLTLTINNADKHVVYTLLTNSLDFELLPFSTTPHKQTTHYNLVDIEYRSTIDEVNFNESFKREIAMLKYCVLAYDRQAFEYMGLVGQNGLLNYHSKIVLSQNLVSSHHNMAQEQLNRSIVRNELAQFNDKSESKDSNQDTSQLQRSFLFPINSQLREVEQCVLYVTKMQKEVQNLFRNNMFYEIAWKQQEIETIMKRMCVNFGDYDAVIQKRKYMQFVFKKAKNDKLFKNKYDSINRQIFIPNYKKKQIENKIINYYIISKEPYLPVESQICKLFVLPNDSQIIDFLQEDPWIIIAASKYVMFIHNYQPMDYFKHEQSLVPSKVVKHHENKNIIIIVDKRGSLFYYSLQDKSVTLYAIYYVPFLIPYSFLQMKNSLILGGIDYQQKKGTFNRNKIQNTRFLYVINLQEKGEVKIKNKSLIYQRKLEITMVSEQQSHIPIVNIQSTSEKQVLACTWKNKFYLVSIQGYKLIEVELKQTITKIMQIPFLFNRLNFMLLINNGQIIRVGIQSYGQCLGAELSKLNYEQANDFTFCHGPNSRFQLLVCKNERMGKVSYFNEQAGVILREESGVIMKVVCNKGGISYLLDLQHSIEVKYLQF